MGPTYAGLVIRHRLIRGRWQIVVREKNEQLLEGGSMDLQA